MKTSVCRNCTERTATCHAECERYKAEWDENRRLGTERIRAHEGDYFSPSELKRNKEAYYRAQYRKKHGL